MKKPPLYRGDVIENSTMPQRYRSCGIISKSINGGNPAYINKNGLLESIQAHINPLTESEKTFLSKSVFISFTTEESIAQNYCSYDKSQNKFFSDDLRKCEEYYETRYIFSLNISDCIPLNATEGIYYLEYNCNPEMRKSDGLNEGIIEFQYASGWGKCEICEGGRKHKMYLIDSVKFLESHKEYTSNPCAFINAQKDKEWLVLPSDFYKRLNGYSSSMIPVSKIWSVKHYYILKNEKPRDPNQFAIPGSVI
jgi:hypothetical protein